MRITKEDNCKIAKSANRKAQKAHGAFDGRFKTKSIPSVKDYSRKTKHKNQSWAT